MQKKEEKLLNSVEHIIETDFYTATFKDGEWIYKAKIPSLKGDKRYTDAPRYPMIFEYEGKFKRQYKQRINLMVNDIKEKLLNFNKKQHGK